MSAFLRPEKVDKFEKLLGYSFNDRNLLAKALTHSSYINENHLLKSECNERLEFLGDAVLELISSEFLFNKYKDIQEGELSKLRAALVYEKALADSARDINLSEFIILGYGESMTGGKNRNSILSDTLEALIGAIYLDGGLTSTKEFVEKHILNDIENKKLFFDSKTIFQEIVQSKNLGIITYKLLEEIGPDHDKRFKEAVYIDNVEYGVGEGHNKKSAEQSAAYQAILKIKAEVR